MLFLCLACFPVASLWAQGAMLRGIVLNAQTHEPVVGASVFNKHNKEADISAADGSFELKVHANTDTLLLAISAVGFEDTLYALTRAETQEWRLYIKPLVKEENSLVKPLLDYGKFDFLYQLPERLRFENPHFFNITDTLESEFTLSVLPYVSTNHQLGSKTRSKVQVNVLAGVSAGIEDLEIGLLLNADFGNVKYLQVSGIANYVEGNVNGTQIAGILNLSAAKVKGLQISGIANLVADSLNGIQIGLIGNYNSTYQEGVSIGGLYNYVPAFKGVQVSGGLNQTRYFDGVQAGFINLSDSCKGVPVGFFSYVKNGYHKWELATDERLMYTLGYRSGVELFHNAFLIGTQLKQEHPVWGIGYGLGTLSEFSGNWKFGADFQVMQMMAIGGPISSLNWVGKVSFTLVYPLLPQWQFFIGPAVSASAFNQSDPSYATHFRTYPLGFFYSETFGEYEVKAWIGFRLGFRIL